MTAVISADPADIDMADRQDDTAEGLAVVPDAKGDDHETRLAQCESIVASQRRYINELEAQRDSLIDLADEGTMAKTEVEALKGLLAERTATLTAIRQMVQCVR